MRPLNTSEKRTIRLAAVAIVGYLVIFYGLKGFNALQEKGARYEATRLEAQTLNVKYLRELKKHKRLKLLRKAWKLDFDKLQLDTAVGDARVALEKTARKCGVGMGFLTETGGRSRGRELAVFQVNGSGKNLNVARFLNEVKRVGYPVVVDNIQLKQAGRPGNVSFSFSVALLSYANWTPTESRRA